VPAALRLIDTHCHLADPTLASQRRELVARAQDAGVVAAIVVGEDYQDNLRVLELAAAEPFVRPALGHHPWRMAEAAADLPRTLALIERHAAELVAIGEVGLDYRVAVTEPERAAQRAVFSEMVRVAMRFELPLSVHVRSAGHYVIELLDELGCNRAALHAFDGKARYMLLGAGRGLYFSLPGTTLVSEQKQKLARALPLERLLFESDTPALSPEPGQGSEPAIVRRVLEHVAALRGLEPEAVAGAAYRNTLLAFPRLAERQGRAT
jgi:TatD DNase family protein